MGVVVVDFPFVIEHWIPLNKVVSHHSQFDKLFDAIIS